MALEAWNAFITVGNAEPEHGRRGTMEVLRAEAVNADTKWAAKACHE